MIGLSSLISSVKDITWPAILDSNAASLLSMLSQLEESQWWSSEALHGKQLEQFSKLAEYAGKYSAFFQNRLNHAGMNVNKIWSSEDFYKIPLLTRNELMTQMDQINCQTISRGHEVTHKTQTSGSTGQVVSVLRTKVTQLMWLSLSMRDHIWHQRDYSASLAIIKAMLTTMDDQHIAMRIGWGHPATMLFKTGPSYTQPISMDVRLQAEWLAKINPQYLLTYPSNLSALLEQFESEGRLPSALKQVRTIGETLHPGLRERCEKIAGIDIVDMYSSQEVGIIALQCPSSGLYHTQDESLIVEVLDDDGRQCLPGEIGRIVITDLHNFATPIIRYEIRDYAEVGPCCPCGRGLLTLSRIMGRRRNMITLPNGNKHWPLVGAFQFRDIADIRQYQVIQHTLNDLEVRLSVTYAISTKQEAKLKDIICKALGYPFQLRFTYSERELEKTRGGKFEEFISQVQ